ncbi:MAG: TIGR03032 family protein [Deltaproteobacteria bacterium RIFOXYD12_FULL_57_12]|nr:MAG: TIGR03032 family protein [Deltaproteobacteria bacterium RIFOXYD12_FULL_57_12]
MNFSNGLIPWLAKLNGSLAFTTYTAGKVVLVGPNRGRLAVTERNFDHAMALLPQEEGLLLSTKFQVWRFENGLESGKIYDGWDKIFLPRHCHVTGAVDVHDLHYDRNGRLVAAVTQYNCLAYLEDKGCFSPMWRPPFIDALVAEDRCHLNGFCLEDGVPAYVTVTGASNVRAGWRELRADGGMVIDARTNETIISGLSMPHSPRLYRGRLWLLEAGRGYLGWVDVKNRRFEPLTWCPGFVRGLRFFGDYALVGISKPRHKTFKGLPLDEELPKRNAEPVCGVYIIRIDDGEIVYKLNITGSVDEIYDVALLPNTQSPLLVGLQGKEVRSLIKFGRNLIK